MNCSIDDETKLMKFTSIFQNLKNITEEINLDFTKTGLYAQGLGVNHVCLVEFNINHSWFSSYNCDKGCTLGINCEVFHSILTCLEKQNLNGIALITIVDDSNFVCEHFSNWIWVYFNYCRIQDNASSCSRSFNANRIYFWSIVGMDFY